MWRRIDLPDADVRIATAYLAAAEAEKLFGLLQTGLAWQRDRVRLFGKEHPIPRMHQWYGDADAAYRWSGLTMQPRPWTAELGRLRQRLEAELGCRFNSVLANLYRNGADSMGWHADDEPELGSDPVIASLSLGAERDFMLRYRDRNAGIATRKFALPGGSLLVMAGKTQAYWQHALPRRARVATPRINLTFRQILAASA